MKLYVRLTFVCLSRTSGITIGLLRPDVRDKQLERPRKIKIGTEVAHVTHDSDTTFKVKRSKVKVRGVGASLKWTCSYAKLFR